MTKVFTDDVEIRFKGDTDQCEARVGLARKRLQGLIDDSQLNDLAQSNRTFNNPDGSIINVIYSHGKPLINIDVRNVESEILPDLFQCDLYEDDPELPPGDLTTQTKRSIAFSVNEVIRYFEIPKRQGNVEWRGKLGEVSWDGTQSAGTGRISNESWNDTVRGIVDEDITEFPYVRPPRPKRAGELIVFWQGYAEIDNLLLSNVQGRAEIVSNEIERELLFKPRVYVNGKEYTFDVDPRLGITGACLGRAKNDLTDKYEGPIWLILVMQDFRIDTVNEGYLADEYIFAQILSELEPNQAITSIKTINYNNPITNFYTNQKCHVTHWGFDKEGENGIALRSEQINQREVDKAALSVVYNRDAEIALTYTPELVTAELLFNTSVPSWLSYNSGEYVMTPEDFALFEEYHSQWGLRIENFKKHDPESENAFPDGSTFLIPNLPREDQYVAFTSIEDGKYYGYISYMNKDDYVSTGISETIPYTQNFNGPVNTILYKDQDESIAYETGVQVIDLEMQYKKFLSKYYFVNYKYLQENVVSAYIIGGSAKHDILFMLEITSPKIYYYANPYTDITTNFWYHQDSYDVTVQLLCMIKGVRSEVGSPIKHKIKHRYVADQKNYQDIPEVPDLFDYIPVGGAFSPFNSEEVWAGAWDKKSSFPMSLEIPMAQFAGSFKVSRDGTHAVISCSYMDLITYLYPWAIGTYASIQPGSYDPDDHSLFYEPWDTMEKIGIDQDTQDALIKYMINYAIIGITDEEEEVTGSKVLQLSKILFGKEVETEPTNPEAIARGEDPEYEFGIKDKDTTSYLPIGLYVGETEEVL